MDDFEYAWDFGEVSKLKSEVEKLQPEVERLTNISNNESRMRQYYVNRLVEIDKPRKGCTFCGEQNPCLEEHCAYKEGK
jgi:hypothetical protein